MLDHCSRWRLTAIVLALALILVATALPTPARATLFHLTASLSGANEVPPNASTATGFADVMLDDVSNLIDVHLTFSNLLAPTTGATLNAPAPPGVEASDIIDFSSFDFPLGVTSGSYDHVFVGLLDTDIIFIRTGLSYINIHNATFPGGEIRGQLEVPVPASLLLLGPGLAGLAGLKRKFWRNPA